MDALIGGIRFGIVLQLAIGPLCLLTFNTAMTQGFWQAMKVVAGISVTDVAYLFLAGLGVARLMKSERVRSRLRLFGCVVLVLFGANMIAETFGYALLPAVSLFRSDSGSNLFLRSAFLTASNPLTILFFSGVFSSQVAEHRYGAKELAVYGAGVMLVTVLFLTGVAALGGVCAGFIPAGGIRMLNAGVGALLIFFGLRLYFDSRAS